jgi:hypothetical protein
MSEKFDTEKEIKELHEKYAYWFELFKRSSDPTEKQDAKKKYKEYIERIIELQNKYNLRIPPPNSSSFRSNMDLDREQEKLILSKEQEYLIRLKNNLEKEKKNVEEYIKEKIEKEEYVDLEKIIIEMDILGLDVTRVSELFYQSRPNPSDTEIDKYMKKLNLNMFFPSYISEYYSGESFLTNIQSKYQDAINLLKQNNIEADIIFNNVVSFFKKAIENTKLASGREYLSLEMDKTKKSWDEAKVTFGKEREYKRLLGEIEKKGEGVKEKDDILCKHAWDYDAALSLKEEASMWRCRFCHRTGRGKLDMHGDPAFQVEAEPKKRKNG